MKLRTKITLIAAAVILLAAAVSDGIIWMICRRTLLQEAEQNVIHRLAVQSAELERYTEQIGGTVTLPELTYYFKTRGDDYTVFVWNGTVVYNQTALELEDLRSAEFLPYAYSTNEIAQIRKNGAEMLVLQGSAGGGVLYAVEDLRPVTHRLTMLAFGMLTISACIAVLTIPLLYLLTRRTLRPLGKLSDSAKLIAAGAYDERAAVTGTDEIGMLAQDFNTMADAVQERIRALAESEERKSMFMADFSHELKTPLTAISGYAQTMRTVRLSEEDQAEALGYIYSESKRLDRLAKKMMRLMELERTERLETENIDISALISAACETCRPAAEKKGITLEQGDCTGSLRGDFDLLHDALCNLIDNACKASNAGQTVRLYTEITRETNDNPNITALSEDCAIVVEDAGCGIPEHEIRNLTEPFYMVDKSRSRRSGGAGLGLSLVAQIIRIHGIRMDIESEPDHGTRIKLHFVYTPLNT